MTDHVSAYRTLAQLGASLPASDPPPPAATAPNVAAPPRPGGPPRWTPPARLTGWDPAARGDGGLLDQLDPSRASARGVPGAGEGTWRLPFTPLLLPTAGRVLGLGELLQRFHPRDPHLRINGRLVRPHATAPADGTHGPAPIPGATVPPGHREPRHDKGERSGAARYAVMVGIGGGLAQNAIDVTRLVKKYPEAHRAGNLGTALRLTALTRPDSRVIDPSAPRVATAASAFKSFTRFDELAMKSSVLLGASLAVIQLASAAPNLADALSQDGPWYENLGQTTSGRAGVLQLAGGGLGVGLFATALRQTAGHAEGFIPTVLAAAKAPIMARPIFGQIGTASAVVVMANELGYLDFLDSDEGRSVGTILRDAAQGTPLINDGSFRTAGLLGAGAIVGVKVGKAIQAAGNGSTLGTGAVIGGAVVAGLLGAQLLGGLDLLDKVPGQPPAS